MYIWARKASNTFSKTFDGNEEAYRKGCTLLLKRVRAIRFCALLLARLFFVCMCYSFVFLFILSFLLWYYLDLYLSHVRAEEDVTYILRTRSTRASKATQSSFPNHLRKMNSRWRRCHVSVSRWTLRN